MSGFMELPSAPRPSERCHLPESRIDVPGLYVPPAVAGRLLSSFKTRNSPYVRPCATLLFVARRSCEVTLRFGKGKSYTAVVQAESAFEAALAFQRHCENAPPELHRPKVDYESVVEVKPIYRVSV